MFAALSQKDGVLRTTDIEHSCASAFEKMKLDGKRVLFIIPDNSRTTPIHIFFEIVYKYLADRVRQIDFMIALGTHQPLNQDEIYHRVGIDKVKHAQQYSKARFFNHKYDDPAHLVSLGTLSSDLVEKISHGLMREEVKVSINKMILDYDALIVIGPTFPHEVVGFSGGNKYFYPGIAGREIIDMSHWLGALITNLKINGIKDTPVRDVLNKAASLIPIERYCISHVVRGMDVAGVFIGTPEEAFSEAADLSRSIHIVYKSKPFDRVLSRAPEMYEDLWTAGKCMYKLEPVVKDGGELIIYAPHIDTISYTHGELIEKIGYHVRDYFVNQMNQFKHIPKGLLAHSTHVKGAGEYLNGVENPRIHVTLATRIPEQLCRKINLGYMNPDDIKIEDWENKEDSGILYVPKAGEQLYRITDRNK